MGQCKCSQCWTLCEVMAELMPGKDYGLTPALGHRPLFVASEQQTMLEAQREAFFRAGGARRRAALPWEEDFAA